MTHMLHSLHFTGAKVVPRLEESLTETHEGLLDNYALCGRWYIIAV